MSRSKRMEPVQRLTRDREETAVRELGASRKELAAQEERLRELRGYREQYTNAFQSTGSTGLGARSLQDYRTFLGRLNEAIRQQETLVRQCLERQQQSHRAWLDSRSRSQAIGKVMAGYRDEEQRQRDRQEQKDTDDRNSRVHTRER